MNRRPIRIAILIISLLLLAGAYGWLIWAIGQEKAAQDGLVEQVALMETAVADQQNPDETLPTLQAQLAGLQAEQTAVQADLVKARRAFPTEIDSTAVLEVIVNQALANGINLRQLTAQSPVTTTLQAGTYRALTYDIQAEGTLSRLGAYFNALENGPISTLTLNDVKLNVQIRNASDNDALYRATLLVKVLTRMALPGEEPLPPNKPDLSVATQLADMAELLTAAEAAGDWERAISLLLAMRQLDAADPGLQTRLADAYVQAGERRRLAGQWDTAVADYEAALELEPENPLAQAGLAAIQSLTPQPTAVIPPTPDATPTAIVKQGPLFFAPAGLRLLANDRHPDLGCDWFGIVGLVADSDDNPQSGITVRVWSPDWAGDQAVSQVDGTYELVLGDAPQAGLWLIQLMEDGEPVSEMVSVQSVADCAGAMIELDWQSNN